MTTSAARRRPLSPGSPRCPEAVPSPRRRPRGHAGFTLVELAIALLIIGILVALGVPAYHNALIKARAAEVLGDFNAIKVAAYNYFAEANEWPDDVLAGEVPPELVDYLPPNFSFEKADYNLDWEYWVLPDGTPKHPDTNVLIGISISTDNEELANAVMQLLGPNTAHYTLSNNYTFIIERL